MKIKELRQWRLWSLKLEGRYRWITSTLYLDVHVLPLHIPVNLEKY